MNQLIPVTITTLKVLNDTERTAIRVALEEYIERHGETRSWSQSIILNDLLPKLFWGD